MAAERVAICDTTLRDGAQGEGIYFSTAAKLRFLEALDAFGIHFAEGGFPGANPRDRHFFEKARNLTLRNTRLVAFGATRRPGIAPENDPQLKALIEAGTQWVAVYGKSSLLHVRDVLRIAPEENLALIADTVAHLRRNRRRVIFDAEHFFDAYAAHPHYALQTLHAARAAGAAILTLCDTNGGTLPHTVYQATLAARQHFPGAIIGIHTHNDSGLAVANTLEAIRAGARHAQGTFNGLGERTGNADLVAIIPAIDLKMAPLASIGKARLKDLTPLSRLTDSLCNRRSFKNQPYVGENAFTHKAGAHASAIRKNTATFEHIRPETVGNNRRILISELAGNASVLAKLEEFGLPCNRETTDRLLAALKNAALKGLSYEGADASFRMFAARTLNEPASRFFELNTFHVDVDKHDRAAPSASRATVSIAIGRRTEIAKGEGVGPVEALDAALTRALTAFYPATTRVRLTDYRVRIINPQAAEKSITRVTIESTDGTAGWTTVGVSENIIEASWQALADSIEYYFLTRKIPPCP